MKKKLTHNAHEYKVHNYLYCSVQPGISIKIHSHPFYALGGWEYGLFLFCSVTRKAINFHFPN